MRANRLAACLSCLQLVVVAACYHFNPSDPCEIACTSTCPSGLECTNGFCHAHGDSCGDPTDAGSDAGDNVCYGSDNVVRICFDAAPTGVVSLVDPFDTGSDNTTCEGRSQTVGPDLCVVAAATITVDHDVRVVGPRALVLIATSTITVGSAGSAVTLDAGSQRSGNNIGDGPDANDLACMAGTPPSDGSAGGAGGSFRGAGGSGGGVGTNNSLGIGGAPAAIVPVVENLRGGCPGSPAGGDSTSGGDGGGAVWMIAGSEIDVFGEIDVSGAGGAPAATGLQPGGGAGAGGMVGFEAPTITLEPATVVSANGGGGGAGGPGFGAIGKDGSDPTTCLMSAGLTQTTGDGNGGTSSCNGAVNGKNASTGNNAGTAGGGGGGGGGFVLVYMATGGMLGSAAIVQPTPIINMF